MGLCAESLIILARNGGPVLLLRFAKALFSRTEFKAKGTGAELTDRNKMGSMASTPEGLHPRTWTLTGSDPLFARRLGCRQK